MDVFVKLTVAGLSDGAILALAALGFVIVYKASNVINFAQGHFLLIGAYVVLAATVDWGLHWVLAVVVAIVAAAVLGVLVERVLLRPLVGQSAISVIMATVGLTYVLAGVVLALWGATPRALPAFIPSDSIEIAGTTIGEAHLWTIGVVVLVLVAFTIFFRYSRHGIAMRAVADDQQAALAMGISVRRVFALAWALAGATAVAGGMLLANLTSVSYELASFGLLVFPVVILGGLDSVLGVVVGGAVIGLLRQYSGFYLDRELSDVRIGGIAENGITGTSELVPYIALVLILLVKPYGLFGQHRIERV
jgi:branched-chain amino acid transport system permease protein